jgi:diguanylate cyclase (GGDEF)-like protein
MLNHSRYLGMLFAAALLLTAIGIFAAAAHSGGTLTIVYPATGLGFGILWMFGRRLWPAVLVSQFLVSSHVSGSTAIGVTVASIEVVTFLLLLWLLEKNRVSPALSRMRDLLRFTGATLITTSLAGFFVAMAELGFGVGGWAQITRDGIYWMAGDFVSIAVFTPLITTWPAWRFLPERRRRIVLALALVLLTLGVSIAIGGELLEPALFLLLPLVIVMALLARVAGTAVAGMILSVTLLGLAVSGTAQFDLFIRLIFVATATLTGYMLAVVWSHSEETTQQLQHAARHDMLTGILNRYALEDRIRRLLSSGRDGSHALLYLDLDQFKLVNDTCGHMAGDSMLKELSLQLSAALPPDAMLARLGGDEFGCLLIDTDEAEAMRVSEALHRAVSAYRFRHGQREFGVGVSIGITLFPAAEGDVPDSILSRADIACYLAKEEAKGETRIYRPADEVMLDWHAAIHEVSQLEQALASGKFTLFCQKIFAIRQGVADPNLYEVLIRLGDGERWQSASEFLPLVQRFGLMERLDRWVIEQACTVLAEQRHTSLRLSINLSGATLSQPAFFDFAMSLPDRYGIEASRLCLEITESVAIQRLRQSVAAMHRLRARGFDIALDDFGAGVASFGYLHELPVTMVKLDGRFVRDLSSDPAAEVIIDSLVRIAAIRDITCIAEWVDSEESVERLRRLGVSYAQGFMLERPRPLSDLTGPVTSTTDDVPLRLRSDPASAQTDYS